MTEQALSEFDLPVEAADALQSVFDKPLVPASPASRMKKRQEYATLATDTRRMGLRQRLYLRHMLSSQMRPRIALKKMNAGVPLAEQLSLRTAMSWHKRSDFASLLERYTQLLLEQAGVGSPAQILLRIDDVVEDALIPVPMYHNGAVLRDELGEVQKEVDRGAALKGLEMLGKAAGAFRKDEETSNRVTVVLDFSGEQQQGEQESEIIDGEFTEVAK